MKWRSNVEEIVCPDGTTRRVHKNLDNAFPLGLKDWSASIRTKLKNLLQMAQADLEIQSQISGLLTEIDEINRTVQLHFRALYLAYSNNPCELDKWFAGQVEELIGKEFRLRLQKVKETTQLIERELAKQPIDKKKLRDITEYTRRKLGTPDINEKTKKEIQTALDDFRKWRRRR